MELFGLKDSESRLKAMTCQSKVNPSFFTLLIQNQTLKCAH